jgi:hypothetical protein
MIEAFPVERKQLAKIEALHLLFHALYKGTLRCYRCYRYLKKELLIVFRTISTNGSSRILEVMILIFPSDRYMQELKGPDP